MATPILTIQLRQIPSCIITATVLLAFSIGQSNQAVASQSEVLQEVLPKTVKLYGAGGLKNLANYGTGFLISPDGHILTVWNHLLDTDQIIAVLDNGRRLPAQFISGAGEAGLAVLKVEVINAPYFDLTEVSRSGPGTPVLGFSNMFNVAAGDEPVSVIHGVIAMLTPLTARRGRFDIPYKGVVFIVDAVMNNPGAAGGALTTQDGKLLGIIGKELKDSRSNLWINYAIPLSDVRETIEKLVRGEVITDDSIELPPVIRPVDTSGLGFRLVPDVVPRTPAYIDFVMPGSTAEAIGLQQDDLIVLINDELIQSCREFYAQLQELRKGDALRMTVRRDRELVNVELIVPELN
ncbi:S1C family serine protease [Rubinisphaera italica]|uniref:Serine endoprotease DegS n=1 Tax=Rubinisphaera italica TaxID=2527969 RepID=A0A5C5XGK6_9PLAN|nr:S1C family serine protease [Rubinisphaera italica]TWT61002.1 Serine endoprotease DegS [Rubinisphaera italica]